MAFLNWRLPGMEPIDDSAIFPAILQETLGSFLLVVFYMMQTDEKMHFSKEPAINCFIISSSYIAARCIFNGAGRNVISNYGACLNPAIALGITMASLFSDGASTLTYTWIYPVLPFAGSFVAYLFYEFVYKKT
jgi:glycerol uptake facilitator-like aquaporin